MYKTLCPYCNEETEINHDDGYGLEEYGVYNDTCNICDKNFTYTTSIRIDHETSKADCLNELKEHDFQQIIGWPKELYRGKFKCSMCGEEKIDYEVLKKATEEYWNKLLNKKE